MTTPKVAKGWVVDFLVRRVGYWLLMWWRLGTAILGVMSFGLIDKGLIGERIYLDACWNLLHKKNCTITVSEDER